MENAEMFISINNRTHINTDQVVKITLHNDRIVYDLVDGTREKEDRCILRDSWHERFEEVRMMLAPVIPASPGYFLIYRKDPVEHSDDYYVIGLPTHYLESVVGWRVDGVGCSPVGLDIIRPLQDDYYVMCPDGRVEGSDGSMFDNVKGFLESAAGT